MAAKKAKGDDWFSSLDAELEKKTKEIIDDVGEQNVARLELNKTLIEDFWKVWKRFNKINVHFALEPSYTNWAVFPDTFPDGDWHWRPGFNPAAVQTIQLLDRSMDQGRVGDALKVNYVEADGKIQLRVTFEYCEGGTLLQVQRLETDLDDSHAVRAASRPGERGRPPPPLRGPRPHLVRKPPATQPRRSHQIPQANVREDRDVQSVSAASQ